MARARWLDSGAGAAARAAPRVPCPWPLAHPEARLTGAARSNTPPPPPQDSANPEMIAAWWLTTTDTEPKRDERPSAKAKSGYNARPLNIKQFFLVFDLVLRTSLAVSLLVVIAGACAARGAPRTHVHSRAAAGARVQHRASRSGPAAKPFRAPLQVSMKSWCNGSAV